MAVKKLRRIRKGKKIAGVAGAFAKYFDVDVVLVRLAFVLFCLPGGIPGILIYIISWIIIPEEGK